MTIALAQTRPVRGDIAANINAHKKCIALAAAKKAGLIIFPELSLTGYEPGLAKELATGINDERFQELQLLSDEHLITIGAGMPVKNNEAASIGMIIFHPKAKRTVYGKHWLHPDEMPFFIAGENIALAINNTPVALGICYEISVPQQQEKAFLNGTKIYIASVAKTEKGVMHAKETLAGIAQKYEATVCMINCVGLSEDGICAGHSFVMNRQGEIIEELGSEEEGILFFDV